jgi:hypothetical protein
MEGGGWLWILVALGVIAFGLALASGTQFWRHRRKDPVTKARTDAATRRNYREDE